MKCYVTRVNEFTQEGEVVYLTLTSKIYNRNMTIKSFHIPAEPPAPRCIAACFQK